MTARRAVAAGVGCGMGAGACWGLVFLAPDLVPAFGPLPMTVGRYLAYGLFSGTLLLPHRRAVLRQLGRAEWAALFRLSLLANTLYYLLLVAAVRRGGAATAALVIGFMPVTVTVIGSRMRGAVPLVRLLPSLACCAAAAGCIGWQALGAAVPAGHPPGPGLGSRLLGLGCAVGALASWTGFAVWNRAWLARLPAVSARDWNALLGLATGAQSLLLLPPALWSAGTGHDPGAWARFGLVSAGVALVASGFGNACWNRASRLLPLTLVGQMIVFETVFALCYGLAWERRPPTTAELAAFALLVGGVILCLRAHRGGDARA